jgi:hypothetical protein
MELIDRYLQAVKFSLPMTQRDDIIKELRDSILSQIEEKEAALGRLLTKDEQVELLKKLGSPMQLASRYGKQQHLIGATMFPIYWKVLKAALGLAFLVQAAASIAMAAAGKPFTASLGALLHYPSVALSVFGWVTVVFAAMDFFGAKIQVNDRWDPRKLPPLVKSDPRKSRFELIARLVIQIIFGVWWLVGLHYQYLIFGPGITLLKFGPVWHTIYPVFVVIVLVDVMFTAAMIARSHWTQGRHVALLVMSALGLIVLYFLINAPELFVASDPSSAESQSLVKTINYALHMGLLIAAIVNVVNIVKEAIRLIGWSFGRSHQAKVGS